MSSVNTQSAIVILLLSTFSPSLSAGDMPAKPILQVSRHSLNSFGLQRESCLRVYSDGRTFYSESRTEGMTLAESSGASPQNHTERLAYVRPERDGHKLRDLEAFIETKAVRSLPAEFESPHRQIDYIESTVVEIALSNGKSKRITTREFDAASPKERSKYPPELVALMTEVQRIEKLAGEKGEPSSVPSDCEPAGK